jgi:hypothetical protein
VKGPLQDYLDNLRAFLSAVLSPEDLDESMAETASHLNERMEELLRAGASTQEAEKTAVTEFGPVGAIAAELIKGYPPKNPINLKKLRWMPELFLVFFIGLTISMFSISKGYEGLGNCASSMIMIGPMLVIPGFFGGIMRLSYRRMKPIAIQTRMATYGVVIASIGTIFIFGLQIVGHIGYFADSIPLYYGAATFTFVGYGAMRTLNSNGKAFAAVYRRFGRR